MDTRLIILFYFSFTYVADATYFHSKPKIQSRLIWGHLAEEGQFPYAVAIKNIFADDVTCGGVIISERHVLTEGWCAGNLDEYNMVVAGCIEANSQDCVMYQIKEIVRHPNYTGIAYDDLAIVTINGTFLFTDYINKVQIATESVKSDVVATVMGWSPELRWMNVFTISNDACDYIWKWNNGTSSAILCTIPGDISGWGDYGCPLVVDGTLIGIPVLTSCSADMHQSVYQYNDWIAGIIGSQ